MTLEKKDQASIRVRVGAKQTVQVRPYESVVVEMSIEMDAGTLVKEVVEAVQNADALYTLIREKVAARAFEARLHGSSVEDTPNSPVGGREWTGRAAPPGSRGSSVKKG